MTFEQTIISFIIAMPLVFTAGILVGRDQREPVSAIPQNLDVAAALTEAKNARTEAQAYQALLAKSIEACRAPVRTEETH